MSFDSANDISCGGKKVFLTWKQAQTHNHLMRRRGSPVKAKGIKIEKLHVYKCKSCKYFHLGHPPRKRLSY